MYPIRAVKLPFPKCFEKVSVFKNLLKITPFQLIAVALFISLTFLVTSIYLSLEIPRLDLELRLSADKQEVLIVKAGDFDYSDESDLPALNAISTVTGPLIPITPAVILEEPDILPYPEFNRFLKSQDSIRSILDEPLITLHLGTGKQLTISPRHSDFSDIPIEFWLQNFYCLSAFMIGIGIWAFRKRQKEVVMLMSIGSGFAIGGVPVAVYSTRELALDGQLFSLLSSLSHLGVFIYMWALIALLWLYPQKLKGSSLIVPVSIVLTFVTWVLDYFQLVGFYDLFVPLCLITVILTIKQWVASRLMLLERAAMQWILLSIGLSTASFFIVVILPAFFGFQPLFGSQGSMLIVIWMMFIGIALGVIRYKLFNLGLWCFYTYLWFFGGVSIIVIDMLLFFALSIPQKISFPIALAIGGWLYFPMRQLLWCRLIPGGGKKVSDYMPMILESFLRSRSDEEILDSWPRLLKKVFSPLNQSYCSTMNTESKIMKNGLVLQIPSIGDHNGIILEYAEQGRRLFSDVDRKLAQALLLLVNQSWKVAKAERQGVYLERERIKRELHDGLGAKIQAIMHSTPDCSDPRPLARDAWRELRAIVSSIEGVHRLLSDVLAEWRNEFLRITEAVEVELAWKVELDDLCYKISPLQVLNLSRSLSEGVQNALRHSDPKKIAVLFILKEEKLLLSLKDDGNSLPPESWRKGRGIYHTINRIEELGGAVEWKKAQPQGIELSIVVPAMG